MVSPTILAYTAGIIDGEGCIGICHQLINNKYDHLKLSVEVASTDRRLIDFLKCNFGGAFSSGKRPNRKPYYRWSCVTSHAEEFLKSIYPYLVIKKEQADIALKFRKTFLRERPPVPDNIVKFRQKCRDDLSRLKRIA